jgi:carbonic anhydrase
MTDTTLSALLERNADHVAGLDADALDAVQDGQHPEVVSVCCSDSRVPQDGMFAVDAPGWLFTSGNIGNRAWRDVDGDRVVDGNLLYPVAHTGTRTIAVVGHTGCGAVTAAYRAATDAIDLADEHPGIAHEVRPLVPVVEEGLERLEAGGIDLGDIDDDAAVNRLVEHNVDRQVAFLRDADGVPADADVYGFVYDLHGVYGDRGRTVLVNVGGVTDRDALRDRLDTTHRNAVGRLTD